MGVSSEARLGSLTSSMYIYIILQSLISCTLTRKGWDGQEDIQDADLPIMEMDSKKSSVIPRASSAHHIDHINQGTAMAVR